MAVFTTFLLREAKAFFCFETNFREKAASMKLNTHLYLLSKLRMSGDYLRFPMRLNTSTIFPFAHCHKPVDFLTWHVHYLSLRLSVPKISVGL